MPELTKTKFITHPQYGRLYRTGDFGRLLPDGSLVFNGRQDDLVKLRGQRIELGEIDSVLIKNATVRDCTTMIVDDMRGEQPQLVSFWIPAKSREDQLKSLKNHRTVVAELLQDATGALPGYMIPSLLIPVDAIPMTKSSKVDKKELRAKLRDMDRETLQLYSRATEAIGDNREFSDREMRIAEILANTTQSPVRDIGRHTALRKPLGDPVCRCPTSKRGAASRGWIYSAGCDSCGPRRHR